MDQRPNIRGKVIKLFEENIAVNLDNFELGRLLTITPKTQSTKEKKRYINCTLLKFKAFGLYCKLNIW